MYADKGIDTEKQYYVTDPHGNVVQLTDENGKVTKTYEYDSFGNEVKPDGKDENPFRYCGEYYDKETDEIYLRARYYQPAVGRFLTRDTYTGEDDEPLSLHLYTYCENDGVNAWDPSGNAISFIRQMVQTWKNSHSGKQFYADTRSGKNKAFMRKYDFFPYYYYDKRAGKTNLTYYVAQNCWQKKYGYNDLYDYVFISATGSFRKKFVLNTRVSSLKRQYILWAWKGDYLNLGAGGELGIYIKHGKFHSDANQRNSMFTGIKVFYGKTLICERHPDQREWWITGFVPTYQNRNPRGVSIRCYANFSQISLPLWNAILRNRKKNPMRRYWSIDVKTRTGVFEW